MKYSQSLHITLSGDSAIMEVQRDGLFGKMELRGGVFRFDLAFSRVEAEFERALAHCR